jgi:hypothetical protein
MARADDGTIPVGHENIIAIFETIRARAIANALLSFLKLLEQPEVAGNCRGATDGNQTRRDRKTCAKRAPLAMGQQDQTNRGCGGWKSRCASAVAIRQRDGIGSWAPRPSAVAVTSSRKTGLPLTTTTPFLCLRHRRQ